MRGTVLHCTRFGAVVRLDDGRLAMLPAEGLGMSTVRRAVTGGRRPAFPFVVDDEVGKRPRIALAVDDRDEPRETAARTRPASSSLEQKIIDYLRQTAEWDPRVGAQEVTRGDTVPRADRLLPFELRARRQYRESPQRPPRPKRPKR